MMTKLDKPHSHTLLAVLLSCVILLATTACSYQGKRTAELSNYRAEMEDFFDELQAAQSAIESIDIMSDAAEDDLLAQLDAISVSCAGIAAVDPPNGYEDVQSKAEHAAAMMGQAGSGFHTAFESTDLDQDAYYAAMEYYKSAGNDIQEIIELLQNSADN